MKLKHKGFTLMEVLISLTVVGIIALIVGGALTMGVRSVEKGEGRSEKLTRFRSSVRIMDSQIQSSFPGSYQFEGKKRYEFTGEGGHMRFATTYSVLGGGRGYITADYRVTRGENGSLSLVLTESITGVPGGKPVTLFTHLDGLSFQYLHVDKNTGKREWVREWTAWDDLPHGVRVLIRDGEREVTLTLPMHSAERRTRMRRRPVRRG